MHPKAPSQFAPKFACLRREIENFWTGAVGKGRTEETSSPHPRLGVWGA